MVSFDCSVEPWIPVIRLDGAPAEMGLRQTLLEAPDLSETRDPLPIVEFGLYRLLVVLVMDIFEIKDTRDLADVLEAGRFDAGFVDAYFEKWKDRFDLFHPQYPFLQTPGMDDEKDKPLSALLPCAPSGTAANFFCHQHEEELALSPGVAARMLTTIAPFMTAGGAGLSPSINGSPPWYVLIRGKNLFETLCLNCCVVPLGELDADTPPAWRNLKPVEKREYCSASLLEGLTWRPRRVRLVPEQSGSCSLSGTECPVIVRRVKLTAGAACRLNWTDPNVPYRITKQGSSVLRPQEGREVWRDTAPLALLNDKSYEGQDGDIRFERPRVIDQFAELVNQGVLDRRMELLLVAYGLRIKDLKMNFQEWHREPLKLPAPLVLSGTFQRWAYKAVEQADGVDYQIRTCIKQAYPRNGSGNKSAFDSLIASARSEYWHSLRERYERFLEELARLNPDQEAEVANLAGVWENDVTRTAWAVFDRAIGDLDTDSEAIRRQMEARRRFNGALRKIFPAPAPKGG